MIFRRLKKSTAEQEEEFGRMMEEEKVSWKDKLAMILSAYFVIVLPCLLILLALCAAMILLLSLF